MTQIRLLHTGSPDKISDLPLSEPWWISQGDNVVFDFHHPRDAFLQQDGLDLILTLPAHSPCQFENFFFAEKPHIESLLTFDDTLYTAREVHDALELAPNHQMTFQQLDEQRSQSSVQILFLDREATQKPLDTAVEGTLYAYYFTLDDDIPLGKKLLVKANGHSLPSWLNLIHLGERRYLLTGHPGERDVGELGIELTLEDE